MTKFYKAAFVLLAFLFCGGIAFSQSPARTAIVCTMPALPTGPLCIFKFKNKIRYTMNSKLLDSINPKTIKALNVEKDLVKNTAFYGSKGVNGVITIEIDKKYARKEYKRLRSYLTKF